jgi:DNA-binding NarL/FixJ family response regulator
LADGTVRTAASDGGGGAALSGVVQGSNVLTTSPAELLSFYSGVNTDLIVKCLQRVHQGEFWFEKALTDSFLLSTCIPLTKREGQLVLLLSQGMKNKEIATELLITEGTVKVYLSKLFQKVGVKDRFELALYGLKNLTTVYHTCQVCVLWSSHGPGKRP